MKTTLLILTTFALLYYGIVYNTGRIIVEPGRAEVASERIKRAVYRMGPGYNYRILKNKILQVYIRGNWLNLKY